MAVGVYAWFGLRSVSRTWFNLDIVWALSLVVVGTDQRRHRARVVTEPRLRRAG